MRRVKNVNVGSAAPGGVYCISKKTLTLIDGFSSHPVGGGDALWWWDLFGICIPWSWFWLKLYGRPKVKEIFNELHSLQKKYIIDDVPVDIVHFYHGDFANRSYIQRHYMLMSQYPIEGKLVKIDEMGLLKWLDVSHFFYGVMARFKYVKDNIYAANFLLKDHIDYLRFVKMFKVFENRKMTKGQIAQTIRQMQIECAVKKVEGEKKK